MASTAWENCYAQRHKTRLERFVEKYVVDAATGCWIWQAAKFAGRPYGIFNNRHAHRVAYELFVGDIPEGLVLDHLCGNGGCVNPAHLEPVTQDENRRRQVERQTHCRHGHPLSGENLALVRVCRTCRSATEQRHLAKRREQS